jgi:hypothetical protein
MAKRTALCLAVLSFAVLDVTAGERQAAGGAGAAVRQLFMPVEAVHLLHLSTKRPIRGILDERGKIILTLQPAVLESKRAGVKIGEAQGMPTEQQRL